MNEPPKTRLILSLMRSAGLSAMRSRRHRTATGMGYSQPSSWPKHYRLTRRLFTNGLSQKRFLTIRLVASCGSISVKFWRVKEAGAKRILDIKLDIMHIVQMPMTARDFKKQRLKKGYTQAQLAREFDIDVITVSRWERKVVVIPRLAELALLSLKPRRKKRGD